MSINQYVETARTVFEIETTGLQDLRNKLDDSFNKACALLSACKGKVVIMGIGKSGHVGRKIAATLSSTGTPSFFVHPAEANHGDLGMITNEDVVIAISYSGETREITSMIPILKREGILLVTLTGNAKSSLAKLADINIDCGVGSEACPLGLAPTTSTTAALVMGDAIAVALLSEKGFSAKDFARSHPGGSLGKQLLTRVSDVMKMESDLPTISVDADIRIAIMEITEKKIGATLVTKNNETVGIITDGDLRRALEKCSDLKELKVTQIMTKNPKSIDCNALVSEALSTMERLNVNHLVAVDNSDLAVGIVGLHQIMQTKLL
jgi:arabinose-5-phosphate isomerase